MKINRGNTSAETINIWQSFLEEGLIIKTSSLHQVELLYESLLWQIFSIMHDGVYINTGNFEIKL